MCGIAGLADPCGPLGPDAAWRAARMTAVIASRGPDGAGTWADEHAALGHRRLAVIDPAHGHQPMVFAGDHDEPLTVLSYNGEVFNHAELRDELELAGCKFTTGTDSEVVLHAFRQWGRDAATRLNGMFALALWDPRRRTLLLARDRLGVKPLFWARSGSAVLFGSEPKALFASGLVQPAVDPDGLRDFLASVRTPGACLYQGVREVVPGTVIEASGRGIREHRYWALGAALHEHDQRATVGHVADLLTDTVGRHLMSDVPLGALLSGGLDSSALTALAAARLRREGRPGLRTFSVGFTGSFAPDALRATQDTPFVHAMARHCGLDHQDIVLDAAALADPGTRETVVAARDAPGTGDMDASLLLLFQAVRRRVTVAISGESADEVFGGYPWFHHRETAADDYPWRYLTGRSGTYQALLRPDVAAELNVGGHRAAHYRQAAAQVPVLPGEGPAQRRARENFYLHLVHWLPDLLDRKDRLSMATGLEVRVPFCDHRLVEYAFNVPWSAHTADGREKTLLRAAVAPLLPDSVLGRVKAPYPAAFDPAYEDATRSQARDLLATPNAPAFELLDPERLRLRLDRPPGDRATRAGLDFALNLDAWLRAGPAGRPAPTPGPR
jgi:asparagine synthase (glutamine-hydrolysing)